MTDQLDLDGLERLAKAAEADWDNVTVTPNTVAHFHHFNPTMALTLISQAREAERMRVERDAALAFIADMGTDLHHARVADWFPEGANNAALQMSEDMRLAGNRCADFDMADEIARLAPATGGGDA